MLQVGVIPITVETLVSEWMHDWGNPKAGELVKEVYSKYGAAIADGSSVNFSFIDLRKDF
jgi:hypothetical protein